MFVHHTVVGKIKERNVAVKQVMDQPHRQDQADVTNPVDGKYFYCVFHRKIAVTVKRDEKEGRYSQHFPPDEEGFQVTGKNDDVITRIKKQDRIKKTLVAFFPDGDKLCCKL